MLADLVAHHVVELDDPIDKFLPASVHAPAFNGHHITLIDLATHTSDLPRLPLNLAPRDPSDPYADYDTTALYAFLGAYMLREAPGKTYEYSNLGVGLLGHLLTLATKKTYAELVAQHVGASVDEDMAELKRASKGKLAVMGNFNGIEMRHWSAQQAEAAVKAAIASAGPGGGFILSDNHGEIPYQVPEEVLLVISEAVRKWGRYPLDWVATSPGAATHA